MSDLCPKCFGRMPSSGACRCEPAMGTASNNVCSTCVSLQLSGYCETLRQYVGPRPYCLNWRGECSPSPRSHT